MNKIKILLAALSVATMFASCSSNDDEPTPPPTTGGSTNIRGVISSDMTLTKDKTWTLRGFVYVTNGATLTIQPGTKIVSKSDSAGVLVITRGARINAAGTAQEP